MEEIVFMPNLYIIQTYVGVFWEQQQNYEGEKPKK